MPQGFVLRHSLIARENALGWRIRSENCKILLWIHLGVNLLFPGSILRKATQWLGFVPLIVHDSILSPLIFGCIFPICSQVFISYLFPIYIYIHIHIHVCVFVNFPWISHYLAIAIRRWPASCSASASPWATRCKSRGISFDVPWTYMGAWFSCLEALRNRWWPMKHDETPWYIWGDELWHIPAILVRKSKCN
jgi:hypothetical protein